jgi:hypothetical protein
MSFHVEQADSDSDFSGWFQSLFSTCFSRAPLANQNTEKDIVEYDEKEEEEISDDEEEEDERSDDEEEEDQRSDYEEEEDEIPNLDEDESDEEEDEENMSVSLLNQLPIISPEITPSTLSSASSFTDISFTTGMRRRAAIHVDTQIRLSKK